MNFSADLLPHGHWPCRLPTSDTVGPAVPGHWYRPLQGRWRKCAALQPGVLEELREFLYIGCVVREGFRHGGFAIGIQRHGANTAQRYLVARLAGDLA